MGCDIPRIVAILLSFWLDCLTLEDESTTILGNFGNNLPSNTATHPRYVNPQAHGCENFHKTCITFYS
jgi:hypothetical protein